MIHHLSIAARDPKHVAGVLAEFMGGVSVPFPPNPGSFFALQLDEHGSGVEVYPAGTQLQPGGSDGGGFVKKPAAEAVVAVTLASPKILSPNDRWLSMVWIRLIGAIRQCTENHPALV